MVEPSPSLPAPPYRHFVIPFSRLPCRASSCNLDLVKTRGDVWCRCLVASVMVSRATRNDSSFTAVALALPPKPNQPLAAARASKGDDGACKGDDGACKGDDTACVASCVGVYLRACGRHIKCLRPEQSTCAAILNAALPPAMGDVQAMFASGELNSIEGKRGCCQGLHVALGGLERALLDFADGALGGQRPICIVLQEGCEGLEQQLPAVLALKRGMPTAFVVVLGDHDGLSPEQQLCVDHCFQSRGIPVLRASLGQTELLASQAIVITHFILDRALGASEVAKPVFDASDKYCDRQRPCCVCCPNHPDLQGGRGGEGGT
jgi:tRNA pseudouridine-54 N-methylase